MANRSNENLESSSESEILQIANQMIDRLQVSDFRPSSISWAEYLMRNPGTPRVPVPSVTSVPVGWCTFTWDILYLPPGLRGKLEPEEWRPLITSSLIYASKLKRKRALGIIARILGPVFLESLCLALLFATWPSIFTGPSLVAFVVGLFLIIAYGVLVVNPFLRNLRLGADRLAADILGRESLLRVLKKISDLGLNDYSDGSGRFATRPSLTERMRVLEMSS